MFTHQPIDRGKPEIRLIRFVKGTLEPERAKSGDSDPSDVELSFELRHAPLDTEMPYAAINGGGFSITRNLSQTLHQLRRNGVSSWLWVDAICLDQGNLSEKEWYIEKMGFIFGHAEIVYAWLGRGDDDSDLLMDLVSRHGPRALACGAPRLKVLPDDEKTALWSYVWDLLSASESAVAPPAEPPADLPVHLSELGHFIRDFLHEGFRVREPSEVVKGVHDLLSRPYWHRIWIIQEVVLAQKVLVAVGTRTVSLDILDAAFLTLQESVWGLPFEAVAKMSQARHRFPYVQVGTLFNIKSLAMRRNRLQQLGEERVCLASVLWETMTTPDRPHYTATDPRDIIYGLLGVIPEEQRRRIHVDYTWTVPQVFTMLTRALIFTAGENFRLELCLPGNEDGPLPTWVVDWEDVGKQGVWPYHINHSRDFHAAGNLVQPIPEWVAEESCEALLQRVGCRVDVVTEVMEPAEWQRESRMPVMLSSPQDWLRSVMDFTRLGERSSPGEDHVWRTVLQDIGFLGRDGPKFNQPESVVALARSVMRQEDIKASDPTERQLSVLRNNAAPESNFQKGEIPNDEEVSAAAKIAQRMACQMNLGRTLFKTRKDMLGIGHTAIAPGDHVVLLWGETTPIVLRERPGGQGWYFRGDAYVDGIMQGEYLEGSPIREEEFNIY